MIDPELRAHRKRVTLVTVLVVLLLATAATKVTSMQLATKWGEDAWRSNDHAAAEKWFAVAGSGNFVQRWIAPYNRGVVAHSRGEWRVAANWYEEALQVAPESAECRIALNWTWALESAGDELAEAGDEQTAARRWAEAKQVLTHADGCDEGAASSEPSSPTPDDQEPAPSEESGPEEKEPSSEEVDEAADGASGAIDRTKERLDNKLEVGDAEPAELPQEEPGEQQAERLTDRNREGARERQRSEDQREGKPDDGDGRTW